LVKHKVSHTIEDSVLKDVEEIKKDLNFSRSAVIEMLVREALLARRTVGKTIRVVK